MSIPLDSLSRDDFQNVGIFTDLFVLDPNIEIRRRPDYWVVECPNQPTFYFGNFLIVPGETLGQGLKPSTLSQWFQSEFGDKEAIRHEAYMIDDPRGDLLEVSVYKEASFETALVDTLTLNGEPQSPQHPNGQIEIRPFSSTEDWERMQADHIEEWAGDTPLDKYTPFVRGRAEAYQELIENGRGQWYGAYLNGQLASHLSIFFWKGVARFQWVHTHPDFRRQGIMQTLVHETLQRSRDKGIKTSVIEAEIDSDAGRLYKSLGFQHCGVALTLCKQP